MKLVHVPTVDLVMRDARKNTALLSPAQEALVFVIYFSAITALEPEEVSGQTFRQTSTPTDDASRC